MPLVLDLPKLCFCLQLVTDVNMDFSVEAIQAIGNLAQGLRTHISGSWRILLPILLVSAIQLVPSFLFLKLGLLLFLLNQLYLDFIALAFFFLFIVKSFGCEILILYSLVANTNRDGQELSFFFLE